MTPNGNEIAFKEFYVDFSGGERLARPWTWFTRDGWRHCSIWVALGQNSCINVTQTIKGVDIRLYEANVHGMMDILCKERKIVYLPVQVGYVPLHYALFLPTCVGLCMRMTGKVFNALTPRQYYRKLLANGGFLLGI